MYGQLKFRLRTDAASLEKRRNSQTIIHATTRMSGAINIQELTQECGARFSLYHGTSGQVGKSRTTYFVRTTNRLGKS